jgi:hypothetical protein
MSKTGFTSFLVIVTQQEKVQENSGRKNKLGTIALQSFVRLLLLGEWRK